MNPKDFIIAKKLKEKLSEVVPIVNLIVFGSRAKGDQDEYSDMDVSIEVASLDKEVKEKIYDIVWAVGFENYMVISPLIFTSYEIISTPLRSAQIVKNIIADGVRI